MLLATFLTIEAQKIYTIRDSIIINEIIKSANNNKQENRILFIASQFMGAPYVASTLDLFANKEPLVIDAQRLDCTTFVEVVTAQYRCGRLSRQLFLSVSSLAPPHSWNEQLVIKLYRVSVGHSRYVIANASLNALVGYVPNVQLGHFFGMLCEIPV